MVYTPMCYTPLCFISPRFIPPRTTLPPSGGAALEFLEGKELPGLTVLQLPSVAPLHEHIHPQPVPVHLLKASPAPGGDVSKRPLSQPDAPSEQSGEEKDPNIAAGVGSGAGKKQCAEGML